MSTLLTPPPTADQPDEPVVPDGFELVGGELREMPVSAESS